MPAIQYAHICEYARVDQSGTVSIIGIFDTIHVPNCPASLPFFHVITHMVGQRGENFQFHTRISAPDGAVIQSTPPVDIAVHQDESGINQINGYLGTTFPVFGVYSVELMIDTTVVHTIPFRVVQRKQA